MTLVPYLFLLIANENNLSKYVSISAALVFEKSCAEDVV
jgi:hypothetical protein